MQHGWYLQFMYILVVYIWLLMFEIISVQRIYSGFKVIEAGIFFTETSDSTSYRPCSQIWLFCVTHIKGFVHQPWHMTGFQLFWVNRDDCHMQAKNSHPFRNTWFHSVWGVHDFTHSLYIHCRICQSWDDVYGLMTGLYTRLILTCFVWTYLITLGDQAYPTIFVWAKWR